MFTAKRKNLFPGVMKIIILVDPSMVIITIHLHVVFMDYAPEYRRRHQFYTFYHKNTSPWIGGHEIYNFLSSYPTDATYQRSISSCEGRC